MNFLIVEASGRLPLLEKLKDKYSIEDSLRDQDLEAKLIAESAIPVIFR